MRRKKVSSEEKDPSLGDGWSFYGKIAPYYSYLAENWSQKQEVGGLRHIEVLCEADEL
jgi:hypothetical protein